MARVDPMLTTTEVLALCDEYDRPIRPNTWSSYVARGQAPEPDERIGRTPRWRRSTILEWITKGGEGE